MIVAKLGYASVEKEYDEAGNNNYQAYYKTDESPLYLDGEYAAIKWVFDDQQQKIRESYYDGDGELILNSKGYAEIARSYDKAGNITLEEYFNTDSEKEANTDGYARMVKTYDGEGHVLTEAYTDVSENPVLRKSVDYAKVVYTYNEAGKKASERCYGTDDQMTACNVRKVMRALRINMTEMAM